MYFEIEKEIEKNTHIFVATDLTNFTVERFTVYGDPILFYPTLYTEDVYNVGISSVYNGLTVYTYELIGGEFSNNQKVYSNGAVLYSFMDEEFREKESEGEFGVTDPTYYGKKEWEEIPKNEWEELQTGEKEAFFKSHYGGGTTYLAYMEKRKNFYPFPLNPISFILTVPDSELLPGYDNPIVFESEEDFEEAKSDEIFKQSLSDENKGVCFIKDTNMWFFLYLANEQIFERELNYSMRVENSGQSYFNFLTKLGNPIYSIYNYPRPYNGSSDNGSFYYGIKLYNRVGSFFGGNFSFALNLMGYKKVQEKMNYLGGITSQRIWWSNYYDDGIYTNFQDNQAAHIGNSSVGNSTFNTLNVQNYLPEYYDTFFTITKI